MLNFFRKHLATVVVSAVTAMVAGGGGAAIAHGVHAAFAHNADKVDQHHAKDISRVAFARTQGQFTGTGRILTTSITAPKKGFLVMTATVDMFVSGGADDFTECWLELDGTTIGSSDRVQHFDSPTNTEQDCDTNAVQPVNKGTYDIDFEGFALSGNATFDEAVLSVQFVPFNAVGKKPNTFGIVAPSTETGTGNN